MIGLIHLLLVDLVKQMGSCDDLQVISQKAKLETIHYRLDRDYPDSEFHSLFRETSNHFNLSFDQTLEKYSCLFFDDAQKRWPVWFKMAKNSQEFLCRQPKIHNQIASGLYDKNLRDRINDKHSVTLENGKLINIYKSENKLCGLYKNLAHLSALYYKDKIELIEVQCMHKGSEFCEIHICWEFIHHA